MNPVVAPQQFIFGFLVPSLNKNRLSQIHWKLIAITQPICMLNTDPDGFPCPFVWSRLIGRTSSRRRSSGSERD
ncbi:hypothetical protein NPIL_196971 [Nephila pilipes]|uniref:Uncharacterized protein n=1 Tax=Nephila pilipes TaxID=299642 RepID=A0A8X6PJC2_NEPPI|nr:hypothetical protein NPIL_196971 [Nephila pilipes]